MIARVGSWLSSAGSAAACAAGDHALILGIQLADRRQLDRLRFDVVVLSKPVACPELSGARLRLTWYLRDSELIEIVPIPGEVWYVQARLKLPWVMRNPGGFDYGLWFKGHDYVATGWVRTGARMAATEPTHLPALQKDVFLEYVNAGLLRVLILRAEALMGWLFSACLPGIGGANQCIEVPDKGLLVVGSEKSADFSLFFAAAQGDAIAVPGVFGFLNHYLGKKTLPPTMILGFPSTYLEHYLIRCEGHYFLYEVAP